MDRWRHVLAVLACVLLTGGLFRLLVAFTTDGILVGATLDFVLLCLPGLLVGYTWWWLPTTPIKTQFHRRIVLWVLAGIAAMTLFTVIRYIHPSVTVQFTVGTRATSIAIGTLAGLGIGIYDAKALTYATTLERVNEKLRAKRTVEAQNEQLRRTEQRLEAAVTELEASNERLEQFASTASHDLQEPLRMITSYLTLIERRYNGKLDADADEFIAFAVDGAERMRAMITSLLEYSRVSTQGEQFKQVCLETLLDTVVTDLQVVIEEREAVLIRNPLPTVYGDERQLQQVFQNLLVNAIEYCEESNPEITLSSSVSDGQWLVSVSDNGIGIDPADTDRIFAIFERLHTADEHEGTGIGLALCKRIVERHNGTITVDSTPNAGSTFTVSLPTGPPTPLSR